MAVPAEAPRGRGKFSEWANLKAPMPRKPGREGLRRLRSLVSFCLGLIDGVSGLMGFLVGLGLVQGCFRFEWTGW